LLKEIAKLGAKLKRHGGNHDMYGKGKTTVPVPRHAEIDEDVARDIIKEFSK
jgi:mRNA interferase HicA